MRNGIVSKHKVDENGNPTGGATTGTGIRIQWQNGPLGTGKDRKEPNGAFVEDVIDAARDRLEFYQGSQFRCNMNSLAIFHLEKALEFLDRRTKEREARGIEGTHTI